MVQLVNFEGIIDYKIVRQLPPPPHTSSLFEYLFAGNGVFIRGIRPGLEVLMPVEYYRENIRGLPILEPYLQLKPDRIPKTILLEMWRHSCLACNTQGAVEIVFHIHHEQNGWRLEIPDQTQHSASCQPTKFDGDSSFHNATIDVHSHHEMKAFFSKTDDADEGGFRIYAVLGRVNTKEPEIRVRVGIFRNYWDIPASDVFELPEFMRDISCDPAIAYKFYSNTNSPILNDSLDKYEPKL